MIARLACKLAYSTRPEHRWRRIALPIVAIVVTVAVFSALSVDALFTRQNDRVLSRYGVIASTPQPADVFVLPRADEWNGTQYPVIWIEPATAELTTLPPGIRTMPKPGEAVVSPALASLLKKEPALKSRYGRTTLIGTPGLDDPSELIAWIRPQVQGSVKNSSSAIRLARFGVDAPSSPGVNLSTVSIVPRQQAAFGLTLLVLLPAALLLVLGLATVSTVRSRRLALMHSLGAGWSQLAQLVVLEAIVLVLPPLLIVAVLWAVVIPRLNTVPLIGKDVFPGDLAVPIAAMGLATIGILGFAALCMVLMSVLPMIAPNNHAILPRPSSCGRIPSAFRLVPLAIALAGMPLGANSHVAPWVFMGAVLAVAGSLALAVPLCLRSLGDWLARVDHVTALLAGRRLSWEPSRNARPFIALASLIIIASLLMSFLAFLREDSSPFVPNQAPSGALVRWEQPTAQQREIVRTALAHDLVIPYREDGRTLILGTDCQTLASFLDWGSTACDANDPYTLSTPTATRLSRVFFGMSVHLQPNVRTADSQRGWIAVLSRDASLPLTAHLRSSLPLPAFPGLTIESLETFTFRQPALATWSDRGSLLAVAILGVGCVIAMIDRSIATRRNRSHLLWLGVPLARLRQTESLTFLTAFFVVSGTAASIGLINVQAYRWFQGGPMPAKAFMTMIAALVICGCVSAIAVGWLSTSTLQESGRDRDA